MPKLILKEKGSEKEETFNFEREGITLGRAEGSSVVLPGSGVSRTHAKIFPDAKDFYVKDLGSGNGTKLNGMRLPKNEKYILKHNDMITIENYDLKFQVIDEMLNQSFNEITDSDMLEVKLLKKVLKALDRETIPSIEVLNGTAEGKKVFFTDDLAEITIGRDPMCGFQIEEYVISRQHARIVKKWGGILIEDLQSKNGVYVNNRRVTEEFLHDGDRIALGTIVLIFRNPKDVSIDEIRKNIEGERLTKKATEPEAKRTTEKPKEEDQGKEGADEEISFTGEALDEEEQKALVARAEKKEYPVPVSKKKREKIKFSAIELCFVGLGLLVFFFGLIMIANLLLS